MGGENTTQAKVSTTEVKLAKKAKIRRKKWHDKLDKVKVNTLLIRDAIVHSLKQNHRAPTLREISDFTGVSVQALKTYQRPGGGFDMELEGVTEMFKALTPDVILAVYARATGNGHSANADAKLWLELQHEYISPTEKAKLDKMPDGQSNLNIMQNGGTINFISAVPDKVDGKP